MLPLRRGTSKIACFCKTVVKQIKNDFKNNPERLPGELPGGLFGRLLIPKGGDGNWDLLACWPLRLAFKQFAYVVAQCVHASLRNTHTHTMRKTRSEHDVEALSEKFDQTIHQWTDV